MSSQGKNSALGWYVASPVMSVQLLPPSVDMTTARPLEMSGPPYRSSSLYCIEPPMSTVSGCPRGEATHMSYEHWPSRKSNEPKPGSELLSEDSAFQPELSVWLSVR